MNLWEYNSEEMQNTENKCSYSSSGKMALRHEWLAPSAVS